MFGAKKVLKELLNQAESELLPLKDLFNALSASMAVIEFTLDGTILKANNNFSIVMGYSTEEISGMHHSKLCQTSYSQSAAYQQFWERLRRGESFGGKFKRLSKSGDIVWLEATYFPVKDQEGKVTKVIKVASDITSSVKEAANIQGLVDAIKRSTAVIEFDLNGIIVDANTNFLEVVAYSRAEIVGQHHRKLCSTEYVQTNEYREFWERLNNGEYFSGQFQRVAKGGRVIWLEATYNPVLGEDGRPYRIIKFAADVTDRVQRLEAEQQAASTAYDVSKETEDLADNGEEIILQSIGKMRQLESHVSESSQQVQSLGDKASQITSIVNTIREIADQTNLLALNAAIEAARAGESGRGSAVVADEVRKLAERTANSTSEIALMITSIQAESQNVIQSMSQSLSEVEEGVELANNAGAAIQQIREGAHKVVNVVQELSHVIEK
jgi:methyl-accepting chemotaxis protein